MAIPGYSDDVPQNTRRKVYTRMFIKWFLCLINGFFKQDEYLQFVIRREALKRTQSKLEHAHDGLRSKKKPIFV